MRQTLAGLSHVSVHLLCAATCLLVLFGLTQRPLDPLVLAAALLGGLLPDLDTHTSLVGRACPPLARYLERRFGHRQEIHSLWLPLGLWLAGELAGAQPARSLLQALAIGYLSHLLIDSLTPGGVAFFLPLSRARLFLLGGKIRHGEASESILLAVLAATTLIAALTFRYEPSELVQRLLPSIDTAREQYRQWEGLYHVYADVEGTWNETHQRYSGRVEVMGFDAGGALRLRDLADERVFTGGRHPVDDMYINTIVLIKGEPIAQEQLLLQPPTPTPIVVVVLVEGVRQPDFEILVRPGDVISKGQLIAELLPPTPPPTPPPLPISSPPSPTLPRALVQAELALAQAEYQKALEGQAASEASVLQAEAHLALLVYMQVNNPELSYLSQQIAAAEARLEEIKRGRGPTRGEIAVAKARLALAELRYQQALLSPTPAPSPSPAAAPVPERIYSLVSGLVRRIHVSRVVGNVASIEIHVELGP